MKEFNLEEAKNGKEVCTRDGHAARIICFDRKSNIKYDNIIALITDDNNIEIAYYYDNNGKYCKCKESKNDLVMKPEKHEGFVWLTRNFTTVTACAFTYKTKEDALSHKPSSEGFVLAKIEWEE